MIQESTRELFDRFARMRQQTIDLLAHLPDSTAEKIPPGFRNNLHWQAGHLVAVQASLLYRRTSQELPLPDEFFTSFAKGTSPADWNADVPSFEATRKELTTQVEVNSRDLELMESLTYPEPVTVSTGHTLCSFLDALAFLPIHEGIHHGMIVAMLKLVDLR
jgi:uncharacterized damage-inducible protein DinB